MEASFESGTPGLPLPFHTLVREKSSGFHLVFAGGVEHESCGCFSGVGYSKMASLCVFITLLICALLVVF